MASFGQCAVCSAPAPRQCPMCKSLAYCSATHQFSDWVEQHKDYCTFGAVAEYGEEDAL